MRLPGLTAEHAIGPAHGTYSSSTTTESTTAIRMMVRYVSKARHRRIMTGYAPGPCQTGYLCWGTGKHQRGYECCPSADACRVTGDGRPNCAAPALRDALRINDPDFTEPGLIDHILSFVK
jgi:hypothetical protein